ncbi:MAG TPA: hypothetical protein VKI44_02215 [Acetobacteraceae bacterium]|nr:hypothetical protein [Acetobacteraceae bacterium]
MLERCNARLLVVAILGVMAAAGVGANASPTCQGSYTAALLQPLPPHVVAGLDVSDRSPRNLDLAERFVTGLRNAGVAVGTQPNVVLRVTTSSLGQDSAQSDRGSVPDYSDFAGLHGGLQPTLPTLPSMGLTASRSPPAPPLMFVRVEATVQGATRISWVASVQCQMIGSSEADFAEELGLVIGSALGERTERRPF